MLDEAAIPSMYVTLATGTVYRTIHFGVCDGRVGAMPEDEEFAAAIGSSGVVAGYCLR